MWPFGKKPAADDNGLPARISPAVAALCLLLRDRPWEWKGYVTKGSKTDDALRHEATGTVLFANELLNTVEMLTPIRVRFYGREYAALRQYMILVLTFRAADPRTLDEAAASCARAVLAGDLVAARALADRVMELTGG